MTRSCKVWVSENIIFVSLFDNIVMDISDARENLEILEKLFPFLDPDYSYGLLIDVHGMKSIDRDAIEMMINAGEGKPETAVALAMVVKSPLARLIGNFIMNFKTLKKPTLLFTEKEEAVEWLKTFIKKK